MTYTSEQLRRLDALAAERVMGWEEKREHGHHWSVPLTCPFFRDWDNATWPYAPMFTTDRADVMELFTSFWVS